MEIKFEMYEELDLLIDQDEVCWVPRAGDQQGNLYGVAGGTEDDLPALNALSISDTDDVADVAAAVKAATGYRVEGVHTGGCAREYVDTEEGYLEVLYDQLAKKFRLVSELETLPLYRFWDGHNWKNIWLPNPDHVIEVDVEEDEDEGPYSLDRWDGNRLSYGGVGCHAEYYPICRIDGDPAEDKYLLRRWSQWEGDEPSGEIVSSEELEKIKAAGE